LESECTGFTNTRHWKGDQKKYYFTDGDRFRMTLMQQVAEEMDSESSL